MENMKNVKRKCIIAILVMTMLCSLSMSVYALSNPSSSSGKVTWDCIYYGSYPQSEVTSTDANYTALKNSTSWDSNGDCTVNGVKYRRVKSSDATYVGSASDYYSWDGNYHYFKYEPIRWRVLQVSDNKALLLSDKLLDDKLFNNSQTSGITWGTSSVRSWLGNTFMNAAFSTKEQSALQSVTLNNQVTYSLMLLGNITFGGGSTTDKVFLLSSADALKYGFSSDAETSDQARVGQSTTYARAMGTQIYANNSGYWWLRTNGNGYDFTGSNIEENGAICVTPEGIVNTGGYSYTSYAAGIRPAVYLDLSDSSLYQTAGTESSSGGGTEIPDVTEPETTAPAENTRKTASLVFTMDTVYKTYGSGVTFNNELNSVTDGKVTFSSGNEAVASVDSLGNVTIVGVGTTYIKAKSAETDNYKAGCVQYTLVVKKANNSIKAGNYTKTCSSSKQSFTINAQAVHYAKLSYQSSSTKVKVSSTGKVTITANYMGKAKITITSAAVANYKSCTKSIYVTVNPPKTSLAKVTSPSKGQLYFKWNTNSKVTGYIIYYSTSSTFATNKGQTKSVTVAGKTKNIWKINGVKRGKRYYVKIRTYYKNGTGTYYSGWSSSKSVVIK